MALKISVGARNFMAGIGSFKDAFQNGRIEIRTGAQPATAEAAVTGTLLCTITSSSLAHTAEVFSSGTVTLTGGAAGSVDTLTVNSIDILGGAVPIKTSLTQTAADVAAQINNFHSTEEYVATSSGAVITITAIPGMGATPNGYVVASTVTTITKTDANMSGGVAPVNGLKFGYAAAAVIQKLASQVWTGVNAASGTAGYFRLYGSAADAGALDATGTVIRLDGAILTAGAEMNMGNTALVATATTTISSFPITLPTA